MTITADQIKNKSGGRTPDEKIADLKRQIEQQENVKLLRKVSASPAGERIRRAMNLLKWIVQRKEEKNIETAMVRVAKKTLETLTFELCNATGITEAGLEGPAKGRHAAEQEQYDPAPAKVSAGGFEDPPEDDDDLDD